jgi:hypothetical protein
MTSDDLTKSQLNRLHVRVVRELQYLNGLVQRMHQLRFPPRDPMFVAAMRAQGEMQSLRMALHYAMCDSGVGRPERRPAAVASSAASASVQPLRKS